MDVDVEKIVGLFVGAIRSKNESIDRGLCENVVRSVVRKISLQEFPLPETTLDSRAVSAFLALEDPEVAVSGRENAILQYLMENQEQFCKLTAGVVSMASIGIDQRIVFSLLEHSTSIQQLTRVTDIMSMASMRIDPGITFGLSEHSTGIQQFTRVTDAVAMIDSGIKPEIATELLHLRTEFSTRLDEAGFRFEHPIPFQSSDFSRPFTARVLNGITGRLGSPAIQDEQPIAELGDMKMSEVLAELTYKFIGNKQGSVVLLTAFFLCHYNFESGSWGPFGCIMKVFIASLTNVSISDWKWFGASGAQLKTDQEFETFIDQASKSAEEISMLETVKTKIGKKRPLFSLEKNKKGTFNVPLLEIITENRALLERTFLPMWAATMEMMARIKFPGNHPQLGYCDAYRFEELNKRQQYTNSKLKRDEKVKFTEGNQSCTVSFSLSSAFVNPNQQAILRASMPHWRIIFPFFLQLPPNARGINPMQEGYVFGCTQNEIVAFSRNLDAPEIGTTRRESLANRDGFVSLFTPSDPSISLEFLPDSRISFPKGQVLVLPPAKQNIPPAVYGSFIAVEQQFASHLMNPPEYDDLIQIMKAYESLDFTKVGEDSFPHFEIQLPDDLLAALTNLKASFTQPPNSKVLNALQDMHSKIVL
jgi:hypothetical protein